MTETFAVMIEGLSFLDDLDEIPSELETKAVQAINKTARRARTESSRRIRRQVGFKASYLNQERLGVRPAYRGKLEARVSARGNPTSLARFVTNMAGDPRASNKKFRKHGVRFAVKPGGAKHVSAEQNRMFAIPLRNGNLGLAIRTSGGKPRAAYRPKQIAPNVFLLYGPSVDQVFRTVREDIEDESAEYLEYEFNRLLDLGGIA